MEGDYASAFRDRFGSYYAAVRGSPDALRRENEAAAEELLLPEAADGWVVQLEAGGSVPPALRALPTFLAFESHPEALRICREAGEDMRSGSPFAVPLPAASCSRVLLLAVLHHYSAPERRRVYAECRRLLRPGGMLVVGDVVAGSAQDEWLNGFVDAHNPSGHRGAFFEPAAEAELLRGCGFAEVAARERRYTWDFSSRPQRADFLRRLFHLTLASPAEVDAGAARVFGSDLCIPWRLAYISGRVAHEE